MVALEECLKLGLPRRRKAALSPKRRIMRRASPAASSATETAFVFPGAMSDGGKGAFNRIGRSDMPSRRKHVPSDLPDVNQPVATGQQKQTFRVSQPSESCTVLICHNHKLLFGSEPL